MAKDQEICLPVLDDLVKDYANGVEGQATGAWQQCDAMRQALLAGDVDKGLAVMREVCPAALEDLRLVFRAKKQKFVELLRTGGDPEAALVCARAELAPLALDAYPEAYGEFKRLLLLLLLVNPNPPADKAHQQRQHQQQGSGGGAAAASGSDRSGGGARGGHVFGGVDAAGLLEPGSTAEFADLAFFTVRSMLGLQQPLLSLQLRFLLRLHGSHPGPGSSPGGAAAAELAPRLRAAPGGGGPDRDPPPLPPPLAAPGPGPGGRGDGASASASGGGPPKFPESGVQAVIHGAGTSRQAALEALKRSGGDALSAFKSEVGRLRLNERLLAELALEYGTFRGLLSVKQAQALEARAVTGAGGGNGGGAAGASDGEQAKQQQQQQQERGAPGRTGAGAGAGPGPLGLARGDASRAGGSPPSKLARRSPPAEEGADTADGGGNGGGGSGQQLAMDVEMGMGGQAPGLPFAASNATGRWDAAAAASRSSDPSSGSEGGARSGSGSGFGSGSGASLQRQHKVSGQEVLATLLRLGQEGDAPGVVALVESVDPALWTEHPALLFDVRRCQYGKLLAGGDITGALELARRELTPLANAHPSLLPLLKSAMAALLPPLPEQPAAASATALAPKPTAPAPCEPAPRPTLLPLFRSFLPPVPGAQPPPPSAAAAASASVAAAVSGSGTPWAPGGSSSPSSSSSSLLPSLPVVVGSIQAVLQPRLGLQGPRLIRLMEGLLSSHRAWMRAEKMSTDPFAEPMRITALRAAAGAAGAGAAGTPATAAQARQQPSPGAAAAAAGTGGGGGVGLRLLPVPMDGWPLPPPPPGGAGAGRMLGAARAAALERMMRQAERERGLMQPWFEMEQQILEQMQMHPFGRDLPPPPPPHPQQLPLPVAAIGGGGPGGPGGLPAFGVGALAGMPQAGAPGFYADEEGGGLGLAGMGVPATGGVAADHDEDDDEEDDDSGGGGDGSGGGGGVGLDVDVDEEGVLQLMEILELPRGAAVDLLVNHHGDVQAAVLSIMGG